jgi:Lrp/AsnC family leucine-responsive transcriptional regulator
MIRNQIGVIALDSDKLLDDVSWQILCELQENARLSYTELGRRVGLTAPAVAERVRRMEEMGIINGYRVELNLEKTGLPLLVFIRIATDERTCLQFGSAVREIPEVLECHRVTGGDSYIVKAAVSSVRHLELLLNQFTVYGQTVTSVVLSSPVTNRVVAPSEPVPAPGHVEASPREGVRV